GHSGVEVVEEAAQRSFLLPAARAKLAPVRSAARGGVEHSPIVLGSGGHGELGPSDESNLARGEGNRLGGRGAGDRRRDSHSRISAWLEPQLDSIRENEVSAHAPEPAREAIAPAESPRPRTSTR